MRIGLAVLFLLGGLLLAAASPPENSDIDRLRELHRRSQPDSVRALASQWLTTSPYAEAGEPRLELLSVWGQAEASFGRGRIAEPLLREALTLARSMGDSLRAARLLRWVGVSVGLQGRVDEADSIYVELLSAARGVVDHELEGWARVGLGWCALQRGQLERCVSENRRARSLHAEAGNALGYSWAMNSEAIALRRLGHFAEARQLYDETIVASREMAGATMLHAMALANRGDLDLLLGDPQGALEAFRRSEYVHNHHQHEREAAVVTLDRCVALLELAHENEAIAALDSLRLHCREHGWIDLEANATNELARAHWAAGHPQWALESYQRTRQRNELPSRSRADAESGERALLLLLGRAKDVLAQLEDLPRVEEPSTRADRTIARARALRMLDRSQEAWQILSALCQGDSLQRLPTESRIDLLSEAGIAAGAAGQHSEALRLLGHAATEWENFRTNPSQARWREQRTAWASRIYPALALAQLAQDSSATSVQRLFDRMQSAKARTLLDRVRGPAIEATVSSEIPPSEVLREGEEFLDLYLAEDAGVLFLATTSGLLVREVEGSEVWRKRLRRLRQLAPNSALRDDARARLRRRLLGEWEPLTQSASMILWSGDGPFLPAAGEMAPDWALVPSWSLLARLRQSQGSARGGVVTHLVGDSGANALPEARREAQWLSNRYTTAAVDGHGLWPASRAAALHFAGHVSADLDVPWTTHLTLDDTNDPREAEWPAWKIASLEGAPPLVVLSGCSTVSGREIAGEGLSGLATAFLCAGARSVVATRWPVEDRFARRFVQTFYDGLEQGRSVAESLRLARRRHQGRNDQPEAFVIVGDPGLRVDLERR